MGVACIWNVLACPQMSLEVLTDPLKWKHKSLSVIQSEKWQPGMMKGSHSGPLCCSLLIWPRPTHTNRPGPDCTVRLNLCAWSVCVCVRSSYFNILTHGSVNSPRLQNEVFRVCIFSSLSCPGLYTIAPLPCHALIVFLPYRSLCLLWVELLGEEIFFH